MNKRTIIGSLAVLAVLTGGISLAQAYNGHGMNYGKGYHSDYGYGEGRGYHRFADCPYNTGEGRGYYGYGSRQGQQLSEDQINKLNSLRSKHFETMEPLRESLHAKRLELNALKYNPNVEPETLSKLVQDIAALENKIDSEREAFRAQLEKDFGIEYYGGFGRHHNMGRRGWY